MTPSERGLLDDLGVITMELLDKMFEVLADDPSHAGQAARDFIHEKRDVLLGVGATGLAQVFQQITNTGADRGALLAAKRSYINSLSMAEAIRIHGLSVEALEASAEPPFRLASIFETIGNYAVKAAPFILKAILNVAGITI